VQLVHELFVSVVLCRLFLLTLRWVLLSLCLGDVRLWLRTFGLIAFDAKSRWHESRHISRKISNLRLRSSCCAFVVKDFYRCDADAGACVAVVVRQVDLEPFVFPFGSFRHREGLVDVVEDREAF
jgi:hypothetical protein